MMSPGDAVDLESPLVADVRVAVVQVAVVLEPSLRPKLLNPEKSRTTFHFINSCNTLANGSRLKSVVFL